jgi:hypothetical protein
MRDTAELVDWARSHARRLETEMSWHAGEGGYGGWWEADSPEAKSRIRARATAAFDFLARFSGAGSEWSARAQEVFQNNGDRQSMESGARGVGDLLLEWATQVESGFVTIPGSEAWDRRAVASTDLMDQVRALLEDPGVHIVAPIVLAGAALEIGLRALVESLELETSGRPSISAYGHCLRSAKILTPQDMKDVEQMAGLRNAAAHGDMGDISRERAALLEQQVNLFLARLRELADRMPAPS